MPSSSSRPSPVLVPTAAFVLVFAIAPTAALIFLYLTFEPAQLVCIFAFGTSLSLAALITLSHVRRYGILAWMPEGLRALLVETTLLEFSLDDSIIGASKKFIALFANPNLEELRSLLLSYSPRARKILLQKGGLGKLFPVFLQRWLDPSLANEDTYFTNLNKLGNKDEIDGESQGHEQISNRNGNSLRASGLASTATSGRAVDVSGATFRVSDLVASARAKNDLSTSGTTAPTTGDILIGQAQSAIWKRFRSSVDAYRLKRVSGVSFCLLVLMMIRFRSMRRLSGRIFGFMLAGSLGTTSVITAIGAYLLSQNVDRSSERSGSMPDNSETRSTGGTKTAGDDAVRNKSRGFAAAKLLIHLLREKSELERRASRAR